MSLLVSLLFKLYIITTLVAKCRIDSFMLRGTGSLCHMFLLNVAFSDACQFRFSNVTFRPSRVFHSFFLSLPVLTRTNRVLEVARIFYQTFKMLCDKFLVLTMSLYAFISLLYRQLLQCTHWKSFTVPTALLTKFAKKFHAKLTSAFIFTKLSKKTRLL